MLIFIRFMSISDLAINKARFDETHWSLVQKAAQTDEDATVALNRLCDLYRVPLYTFLAHRGVPSADAEDLIQGFFLDLIQRNAVQFADRNKGRFRSFLLASLKNFISNERDRQLTLKRGGGFSILSLDAPHSELIYEDLQTNGSDSERLFDRSWAIATLEHALSALREEYAAEGRISLFEALHSILSKEDTGFAYADIARQLGKSEEAIRMAASRIRRRFRELLHREILKTLTNPSDVEDELRYLFSCL